MKHLALAVALISLAPALPGEVHRFFIQGSATDYLLAPIPEPGGQRVGASTPILEDSSDKPFSQDTSQSPGVSAAPRPMADAVQSPMPGCVASAAIKEITVKRINIVDPVSGEVQVVMAGALPGPVVRGREMERTITPAGIIWHDGNGDESGGLVTAPVATWKGAPAGKVRMVTFDYTHQITDAVRLGTFESDDGQQWEGGLTVYDRRPHELGPVVSSQGKQRIFLGSDDENAGLVILDKQERERIRIGVDQNGAAVIEMLDENGNVVFRAPE